MSYWRKSTSRRASSESPCAHNRDTICGGIFRWAFPSPDNPFPPSHIYALSVVYQTRDLTPGGFLSVRCCPLPGPSIVGFAWRDYADFLSVSHRLMQLAIRQRKAQRRRQVINLCHSAVGSSMTSQPASRRVSVRAELSSTPLMLSAIIAEEIVWHDWRFHSGTTYSKRSHLQKVVPGCAKRQPTNERTT